MKKRILSILLMFCMVIGLLPTTAFANSDAAKAIQLGASGISGYDSTNGSYDYIHFGTWNNSPIKWRVLDTKTNMPNAQEGDGFFLLSDALLGTGEYGGVEFDYTTPYTNDWKGSRGQDWCNGFYSRNFSTTEQKAVFATSKSDDPYIDGYFIGSENILNGDKVFFLSAEEVGNAAYGFTDDDARIANYGDSAGGWWLRSPHRDYDAAGMVNASGDVGAYWVNDTNAARPAFNLKPDPVLLVSAAVGGKGAVDGIFKIPEYSGNEWKLTLLDDTRTFKVTETAAVGKPGGTVTLNFSGARTGRNEYISVIIEGESGVTHYGRIMKPTATDRQLSFTIPYDLASGNYNLYVFSEQYNGDHKTDYASRFQKVVLTVEEAANEQFALTPGGTYYFDLSGAGIPGAANGSLPDASLHYVPFTYTGIVDAYTLTSEMATTEEYARQNEYAHSLFVADHVVTHTVNWNALNDASLIFGKGYAAGGVEYTLRAPSVGSDVTAGSDDLECGTPQSNEWDRMLDKNNGYIKNWSGMSSWGQDTPSTEASSRAVRGCDSARGWHNRIAATSDSSVGFRPVLEVLDPDTLGSDGLKAVVLDLGGGKLGNRSENIQIIVKSGESFTAPGGDGLTHPDGNTGSYFMWLGSDGELYDSGDSVPAVVNKLTARFAPIEQFSLVPGGTYYFDLSGTGIRGTAHSRLPDKTLHYVPFTYAGTVDAYKLTSTMATTAAYAQQNKYAHSLFVADYAITHTVSWENLNSAGLIFGKGYTSGGVEYTLRAPSVGSSGVGSNYSQHGIPQSNEWDKMLDKDNGYIKNFRQIYSFGQDTTSSSESGRASRGYNAPRIWHRTVATRSNEALGFRPVLEVLNPDTLGSDGLKVVVLDLGGGTLGSGRLSVSSDIQIIVKNGESFTAPASNGLTRPDGNTGSYFMWRGSDGALYAPGDSVPANVNKLTAQFDSIEQFTLVPGGTYWFDLSGAGIPGTANGSLPDASLHYVPFTYAGTVDAYALTSEMATTDEYAEKHKYPHSLFVADFAVTHTISWKDLNSAGLIFGKNYTADSVEYTMRVPSAGRSYRGSGDSVRGNPQSNEWDKILDKYDGYIRNCNATDSWGQDVAHNWAQGRAMRGYSSVRNWNFTNASDSGSHLGFRPILEVLNPDTLNPNGLKAVTLDLGGGKLGNSSEDIQIIVKSGKSFTAPASDGLTRADGDTGSYFMWRGSNGKLYAPYDNVPADVTKLTAQFAPSSHSVTINTDTLPGGKVGEAYSQTLIATGIEPITWSIISGELPKDLTLKETTGEISGTPTTAGTSTFTVKATNSAGSNTKELSITIAKAAPTEHTVTVTTEGGGTASADPSTATAGTTITLTPTPDEGYHFKKWQVMRGNVTIKDDKFTMPDSEVEIKAIFEEDAPSAEDLVDPVIRIIPSKHGGYPTQGGIRTAADFFKPGEAPKGAKITAITPPASPSILDSISVDDDGLLSYAKKNEADAERLKTDVYTVTITSDDYAPITAPLTVRQYLFAGFRAALDVRDWVYGDTRTYKWKAINPGENGTWSAIMQEQGIFEIYEETVDTTSEPGVSHYTTKVRAIKAGQTFIDILYVSDTTASWSPWTHSTVFAGGKVVVRGLTVTAGSATITKGDALPTDLVSCTGLLDSEGRTDDRDTVLDNALSYRMLNVNNEEITAEAARNTPGTYTVVPAATLKSGWDERYSLNRVNGTLTVEDKVIEQFTITYNLAGGTAEGNPGTYTIETGAFTLMNPTKSGYTFTGWSGTGLTGENNLTVTIPTGSTGNRIYTAHWRYNGSGHSYSYYTIKATAGTGGSISPSGNVSVREGRDQTFTITPDKGYAVANVKIDSKSIGAVKSYTFENVRRTHTIEVIFMKANGAPQTGVFVDVATGSYYEDAVDWAVENGITMGTDDTHFSPDGICTRAQAVTFLWRAAGSPEPETRAMPFADVPVGSYYYDAVLWAVENGITKGTSDTTFSPNATCSRAQIVVFLWRSEKSPAAGTANPFADVKSTAYYADAVLWAVREDITMGTTSTTFSPDADCTRAQIVTFLWRCKK
ncbi:S-layer homology domain-containing protein [Pseudoflavonifractor sp. MSJ-37]|uniref:S-layer homology domain-containing protein n=1 Tax=Pseudoflavonifractor sp. MSJ-37 TaxID=2841531 RepID=UPI001C12252C|nr:S-layer homology domain-containing protein [Pseudoflavonifractor sp. MSJ-37]MBU5435473.1 S-layer homology domain-containing protein [Pseudoflavonifractor sp. MSJ-37]